MLGQSNDICKTHTFLWITNTQYRLAQEIKIDMVHVEVTARPGNITEFSVREI